VHWRLIKAVDTIVAKGGWLQSRDIKGEAVIIYRNPLITKDLELSGFPRGKKIVLFCTSSG
jgi:hypothetical protein